MLYIFQTWLNAFTFNEFHKDLGKFVLIGCKIIQDFGQCFLEFFSSLNLLKQFLGCDYCRPVIYHSLTSEEISKGLFCFLRSCGDVNFEKPFPIEPHSLTRWQVNPPIAPTGQYGESRFGRPAVALQLILIPIVQIVFPCLDFNHYTALAINLKVVVNSITV